MEELRVHTISISVQMNLQDTKVTMENWDQLKISMKKYIITMIPTLESNQEN